MNADRNAGHSADADRIRLRKTTSDLHAEMLKSRKLEGVIKRLKAEHKREIEALQIQIEALHEFELASVRETSNFAVETECTSFKDNQAIETTECAEEATNRNVAGSIYDEIYRTLPDLSICTRSRQTEQDTIALESSSNTLEDNALTEVPVLTQAAVSEEIAIREPVEHESDDCVVGEISLLECKRVCSLITQRKQGERRYTHEQASSDGTYENETSDVDDYFIKAIEVSLKRPEMDIEERRAILEPQRMRGSVWQRITDSQRIRVSQGRLDVE